MLSPRLARTALCAIAFATCALAPCLARAQFANHSIGLEVGGLYIANPSAQNIGSGGGIGIDSTLYIESGFDLVFRVLLTINRQWQPEANVIGILPTVGFRYLFSEDTIRPYLGLSLAYLGMLTGAADTSHVNVVPTAGVEFFVSNNTALSIQAEYHLIIALNSPLEHAIVGLARVGWYF